MTSTFISHSYKRFTRSVSAGKDATTQVFLGIILLMVGGYLLALGFGLEMIITNGLQQDNPIEFLNGLLIYYFVFEFMMRYFMQNLPVMDVQPYLHLPISRKSMVHFMLGRSLVHAANLFIFLLFTPFAVTVVANEAGAAAACTWLASIWLVSLMLHFTIVLFKKKLDDSVWGLLLLILIFGGLGGADFFGWFKLSQLSQAFFEFSLHGFYILLALLSLLVITYAVNFQFFKNALYVEEIRSTEAQNFRSADWAYLRNFGLTGEWINIELKLILRNKRPRTILFLSAFFLLYGLFFYSNPKYTEEMPGFLLFVGIFITGIFMINYGQFLFSWQGSHYDFTLTQPTSMRQFVESKYWLLASVTLACFLLSIPYVYFGWNILLVHLAALFFNLGINVFIIMNMSLWEPRKIDLSKGGTFNYEGVGAAQWLMGIPILLSPYIFYTPLSLMGYPQGGLALVGAVGFLGVVLRNKLLTLTTQRLLKKRYVIAGNFRKD